MTAIRRILKLNLKDCANEVTQEKGSLAVSWHGISVLFLRPVFKFLTAVKVQIRSGSNA